MNRLQPIGVRSKRPDNAHPTKQRKYMAEKTTSGAAECKRNNTGKPGGHQQCRHTSGSNHSIYSWESNYNGKHIAYVSGTPFAAVNFAHTTPAGPGIASIAGMSSERTDPDAGSVLSACSVYQ